ncbi:hypothetical protein ACFZDG_30195 [Kitasatospora xanthocidica]|uniref:hypothetical protein n=1 Tax=Kitasatospora xanthocidica TaxID=83382 RepID=UPI0036E4C9C2
MITATGTVPPPAEYGAPRTPVEAIALLADRRATGAVHGPLGTLHLVDGEVVGAESPRAPGLADLLTGCGRITPEDWSELVHVHGPRARVGEVLVERRLITRGELELGHLGTLFDAAFFVLADHGGGLWRFESDARHWLGPVATVDPHRLCREVERRSRLLDRIWPWAQLDTAPVRPVEHSRRPSHRPPGRRRRELLDHADGRRTPADLARLLGRSGFGVTADVRRLAAAGLLDPPSATVSSATPPSGAVPSATEPPVAAAPVTVPPPVARAAHAGRALGVLHRRIPGASLRGGAQSGAVIVGGAQVGPVVVTPAAAARAAEPEPAVPGPAEPEPAVPGPAVPGPTVPGPTAARPEAGTPARPERQPTPAAAHPLTVPDPDIALLTRVRDLLEARL